MRFIVTILYSVLSFQLAYNHLDKIMFNFYNQDFELNLDPTRLSILEFMELRCYLRLNSYQVDQIWFGKVFFSLWIYHFLTTPWKVIEGALEHIYQPPHSCWCIR